MPIVGSHNFHSQDTVKRSIFENLCQNHKTSIVFLMDDHLTVSKTFSKFMKRIMQGCLYILQYSIITETSLVFSSRMIFNIYNLIRIDHFRECFLESIAENVCNDLLICI